MTNIIYKKCTNCSIPKNIELFYKSCKGKHGVRSVCIECSISVRKDYQKENKDKIKLYNSQPKFKAYTKQWLLDNPNYKADYNIENKVHINELHRIRCNYRLQTEPLFKLRSNIRTLIKNSMANQFTIKSKKTIDILGCTFEEFKIHIEKQFDDKMNWDNHGSYWHYDHIKPISLAQNEQEVYDLNHYTNFQPLERIKNIKKGNKY